MTRHRVLASLAGLVLASAVAAPALAGRPDRSVEVIEDSFLLAECAGYDVVQANVVELKVTTIFDNEGGFSRAVTHADTVGVARQIYADGSTVEVATYRDQGGIFIEGSDDTFTWTGIVDRYTLRDGTMLVNIGNQKLQVIEWDPFAAVWIRDVGRYTLDSDPCTW